MRGRLEHIVRRLDRNCPAAPPLHEFWNRGRDELELLFVRMESPKTEVAHAIPKLDSVRSGATDCEEVELRQDAELRGWIDDRRLTLGHDDAATERG